MLDIENKSSTHYKLPPTTYLGGFSTLELLIAFALLITTITAATLVSFGNQSISLDTELNSAALQKAVNELEDSRALSREDFLALNSTPTSTSGIYDIKRDIFDISPCSKRATANVTWDSSPILPQITQLATVLGGVEELVALGDCDPVEPGDWDNPDSLAWTPTSADIPSATGLDVATMGGNRYIFLSAEYSPAPAKHSFWVVDATNPVGDLTPLSSLPDIHERLNGVAVAHNKVDDRWYAYVLKDDNSDQLNVIDVTVPATPVWVTSKTLPDLVSVCAPPCLAGKTIYYYDDKLYIGTDYIAFGGPGENNEFHIYDVSDPFDPSWPVWEARINVDRNINDIVVRNGLAFLATGTGGDNTPLKIYDIDPSSLTYLQQLAAFGAGSPEFGTAVYVLGSKVYLGRTHATNPARRDFYILDWQKLLDGEPLSEVILGSMRNKDACAKQPNCGLNTNNDFVAAIHVQGKYAFLANSEETAGFQVWLIDDPGDIRQPSKCATYNYSEKASDIAYSDDYVFVTNLTNKRLRIIHNDDSSVCPL